MRFVLCLIISFVAASFNPVLADDRLVRLAVPQTLAESGLMKFMLPRFSLKTQVRVRVVAASDPADAVLGLSGRPVFTGAGETWFLQVVSPDHPGTQKFADWLTSEVGQRAVTGFRRDGEQVFTLPVVQAAVEEEVVFDGDAAKGKDLSVRHCGRCHVSTKENRMRGIGSTPSFFVLRAFDDWDQRFSAFFALKPHAAFTQIEDVTPPFPADRPSPIVPIEMTLDDLDAILAYVAALEAADLGAPLKHQ